jgi:hypothetical protein
MLAGEGAEKTLPRLELEWSDETGSGRVVNRFQDGSELVTFFARYEDDDGLHPRGLFVGGAMPEVAGSSRGDESGMSYRDARGWHHIWCNTNEAFRDDDANRMWQPGSWTFLGARTLIAAPDRVVLESAHAIPVEGGVLRITRFAYFRAGAPFFKLGMRVENATERPVRFSYTYGDEPWVGHYGSSDGNIGFLPGKLVRAESAFDLTGGFAGILDEATGLAAFLAWPPGSRPDLGYFANDVGFHPERVGTPLTSNSVFIGLDWISRALAPGEGTSILLSIGMARAPGPRAVPALPPLALP